MARQVRQDSALRAQESSGGATELRSLSMVQQCPAEKVPIQSLRGADSPRFSCTDEEHTRLLAATETELPPILVHRETRRVIDGMHRLHAARLRGDEQIEVRFFDGDAKDAFVLAVQSNITHGLPLSTAERTRAARRMIGTHQHWSDRIIAEAVGLSAKTVASVRRSSTEEIPQSNRRVGKDGRVRPVDGAVGRLRAHELLKRSPGMPLRVIAEEAGISISTVWDVRARIKRGDDPVPPRQRKAMATASQSRPRTVVRTDIDDNDLDDGLGSRQSPAASERIVNDTLERLRKDPSLRFSEAGRDFLRWVESRVISPHEWNQFIDRLPPHQASLIMAIARKNAGLWREFAEQLRARQALVDGQGDQ
ncbi:transcriptional regulator NovG [Streptomyces scabiei]|uniref:Transcriptional regulator NovG n=2 Tax=Streptomyces scabiei TaxID=1930 RepID=A0A117ED22_STRSC|nr:transcriptional regulator NovG [Streptomyces scabiei]